MGRKKSHLKVLFLDVDGVLNSARYLRENPGAFDRKDESKHFDPAACARLDRVLFSTGAKVVVSSTWRLTNTTSQIERFLISRGAASARIIGATPPSWAGSRRGDEIQEYLDGHPGVTRFAIVDDDSDMLHLIPRLVKTTWEEGLLDDHVEKLIRMLSTEDGT